MNLPLELQRGYELEKYINEMNLPRMQSRPHRRKSYELIFDEKYNKLTICFSIKTKIFHLSKDNLKTFPSKLFDNEDISINFDILDRITNEKQNNHGNDGACYESMSDED